MSQTVISKFATVRASVQRGQPHGCALNPENSAYLLMLWLMGGVPRLIRDGPSRQGLLIVTSSPYGGGRETGGSRRLIDFLISLEYKGLFIKTPN